MAHGGRPAAVDLAGDAEEAEPLPVDEVAEAGAVADATPELVDPRQEWQVRERAVDVALA